MWPSPAASVLQRRVCELKEGGPGHAAGVTAVTGTVPARRPLRCIAHTMLLQVAAPPAIATRAAPRARPVAMTHTLKACMPRSQRAALA